MQLKCAITGCKCGVAVIYYRRLVCDKHWRMHCDPNNKFDLKRRFKIIDTNETQLNL